MIPLTPVPDPWLTYGVTAFCIVFIGVGFSWGWVKAKVRR